MSLNLFNASIHKIDIKQSTIGEPFTEITDDDISQYLIALIGDIIESPRKQKFKLGEDITVIPNLIEGLLLTENFIPSSSTLAKKLHSAEINTQEKYKGITELREGSLLCAYISILEEQKYILIVKIDHAGYLNEKDFKKTFGLPEKQRAQKTAIIKIVDDEIDPIVTISDSSSKVTEYWWKDFLELLPLSSPEANTEKAFKAIETFLIRNVKNKSQSDYWAIRNAVVSYFNTRESCVFHELIKETLSNYIPDDEKINPQELMEGLNELPEKKDFDSQFTIVKNIIKAKIKKQIRLAENLELQIKGEIENFDSKFDTGKDDKGKFLKIYSDEGYEVFHKGTEE